MLFSSISFVYYFLPLVLIVYFSVPKKLKNYWLLASSLFFYFWGEPVFTALMLSSIAVNFLLGLYIGKKRGAVSSRRVLAAAIIANLLVLGFFKYADFVISIINGVTGAGMPLLRLPLPLGISFYTFQIISYVVDVYRGEVGVTKNPLNFATYVSFFPQRLAGPIVNYKTVQNELTDRRHSMADFAQGAERFVIGLAKKVLIADQLTELYAAAASPAQNSVAFSWLSVIIFALQVYFDFSGYSDMAIGLGRVFGFKFLENFNYPFISSSISEFWRRWHISLGTWFREYLYIPLGGSRVSRLKWLRNLFVVWFATGLWHGASWNFILWGLYFGVMLGLEKIVLGRLIEKWPSAIRHFYTIAIVTFSFVIFQNETVLAGIKQFGAMFGAAKLPAFGAETLYVLRSFALLIVIAIIGATPLPKKIALALRTKAPKVMTIAEPVFIACMLLLCTAYLMDSTFNPFLYFRF